jgi:hypothetical protein
MAHQKEFVQYEHHKTDVWVRLVQKGVHRDYCLCYACTKFHPGKPDNCPIAEKVYALCKEESLVLPVWECPVFTQPGGDDGTD